MHDLLEIFAGPWTANHDRSELDPNHRFRQATLRLEAAGGGVRVIGEGIGPDGQPCVDATSILIPDGGPREIPEAPGVTVRCARPDPNTIEVVAEKDGVTVGEARYSVSQARDTLTARTSGTDAQGRPFQTTVVFDRGHASAE